jgi:putative two-component system response regulator
MLTALSGVEDKVRAYELGADDFLNKPVNLHELVARVRSMIKIKRLRDELDTSESIIVSMVEALESKDPRATGHSQRVAALAIQLARSLDLGEEQVEVLAKAAILHDIGKIGLPVTLLEAADHLSAEQLGEYQRHPVLGERILAPFLSFSPVRTLVRHHHERLDGSGYPDGLRGSELGLETEILSLANLYDQLSSHGGNHAAAAAALGGLALRGAYHRDLVERLLALVPSVAQVPAERLHELLPMPGVIGTGRILLSCGSPTISEFLGKILSGEGHEVIMAPTEQELMTAVDAATPDLVLLDVHLPGRGGIELSREIKANPKTEFLPVVLVTAHHDLDARFRGSRVGADDFLFLPINRLELIARVKSLLRLRMYFKDLEEHQSVILSLASALEAKDPYTRGHSERVGVLAAQLGRSLGLSEANCDLLRIAGQLHDIGKIGMPETLLNKQGRLDDQEFRTVMQHPLLGERICRPLRTMQAILPLVRHHHERFDGSGYPDRLRGEAMPIGARILGLVDAYDAITSARSYRRSFTPAQALELLARETDVGRWDPEVFAALVALVGSP